MKTYYLILDNAGVVTGGGCILGNVVPDGRVECTQEQATNPNAWAVVGGDVVPKAQSEAAE